MGSFVVTSLFRNTPFYRSYDRFVTPFGGSIQVHTHTRTHTYTHTVLHDIRYEDPVTPDITNEDFSQFLNLTHTQTLTPILTSFGKVVMFAKNYILNHFPTVKFLIV